MKSLYESILSSTKSGKSKISLLFSKEYKKSDLHQIESDMYSFYKVDRRRIDFEDIIKYVDENTFIYMDPPYRPLNATSNFNEYSKEPFNDYAQRRLAKFYNELNKKGAKIMESNSDPKNTDENDEFFDELYSNYNISRISASRSINSKGTGRGKVSEILITNY